MNTIRIAQVHTKESRFILSSMTFSWFQIPLIQTALQLSRNSAQAVICDGQIANSLAGGGVNRVAERSDKRGHAGFTDARRGSVAIHDVHIGLSRNFIDSSHGVVLKIRLVDGALRRRDLPAAGDAGAKDRGTLELGPRCFRIYHQPRIQNRIHARDAHYALVIYFDFNDRGHVGQETPVRRDAHASALAVLAFSPPGFFRHHLRNVAQTPGFPGIGVCATLRRWWRKNPPGENASTARALAWASRRTGVSCPTWPRSLKSK